MLDSTGTGRRPGRVAARPRPRRPGRGRPRPGCPRRAAGGECDTGHPLNGRLGNAGWYGRTSQDRETAPTVGTSR
ncbi:GXWXG domain-containing protein [Streptomyces sp. NPDC001595]|uniref:GXWXG domain-containing protein n=1 Tax=Streptomyces sp. NPDC001532 TaxID=3154520 RepID=UPI003333FFA8